MKKLPLKFLSALLAATLLLLLPACKPSESVTDGDVSGSPEIKKLEVIAEELPLSGESGAAFDGQILAVTKYRIFYAVSEPSPSDGNTEKITYSVYNMEQRASEVIGELDGVLPKTYSYALAGEDKLYFIPGFPAAGESAEEYRLTALDAAEKKLETLLTLPSAAEIYTFDDNRLLIATDGYPGASELSFYDIETAKLSMAVSGARGHDLLGEDVNSDKSDFYIESIPRVSPSEDRIYTFFVTLDEREQPLKTELRAFDSGAALIRTVDLAEYDIPHYSRMNAFGRYLFLEQQSKSESAVDHSMKLFELDGNYLNEKYAFTAGSSVTVLPTAAKKRSDFPYAFFKEEMSDDQSSAEWFSCLNYENGKISSFAFDYLAIDKNRTTLADCYVSVGGDFVLVLAPSHDPDDRVCYFVDGIFIQSFLNL